MNFENEYLLNLKKLIRDKCSKECQFEDLEDKLIEEKNQIKNYKNWEDHYENFQCFHRCNSKNFEIGLISLESFGEYLRKE
jgi:hypothetical protein